MEIVNYRELATLIWLGVFLAWAFYRVPKITSSFQNLFRAAFVGRLNILYALLLLYVALMVWSLHEVGLWEPEIGQIKATVMWVITAGLVAVFRAIEFHDKPGYLKQSAKDILNITVVLEFVVGFVTFGLAAELVIVPFVTLLAAVHAYAEVSEENESVAKFFDWLFVILGVLVLGHAVYEIALGFGEFASADTLLDFTTPIVFSFLFLPFIYFLSVYVAYENVITRIGFNCADEEIESRAKWRAALAFNFNTRALARWADHLNYNRLESKEAIGKSIAEVKSRLAYERNPRAIPEEEGWSPFKAKDFLLSKGFRTGHYKHLGDGEWFVSTNALDVGEKFSSNSISYYVSGDEFAAKELKLKLSVLRPDRDNGVAEFVDVAECLLSEALGGQASTNLKQIIEQGVDAELSYGHTKISISKEPWDMSDTGQYDVRLCLAR